MTTRQLHAQVSPRLLAELPRFFGSFEKALGELFQNAHRAGATQVRVIHNPADHSLTLIDDGAGLDDPQKLLTAGETGWDEARVIEPAGVGAFAILREEFVTRVEYESRGAGAWAMALTPAVLRGAPAQVAPRPAGAGEHGLSVTLHLHPSVTLTEDLVRRARGLYPFQVHYTDDARHAEAWRALEPHRAWAPDLKIATPVGALEWSGRRHTDCRAHLDEAVWEHRALTTLALQNALGRAAEHHCHVELAGHLLRFGCVRWFVEPASGVRPKLPDRNELQDDAALARAAAQLTDALVERVIEELRAATCAWPARIENLWSLNQELAPWQGDSRLLECVLPILGWRTVSFTALDDVHVYDSMDVVEIETPQVTQHDRAARIVASGALNQTLNMLGQPAARRRDATDPQVTVTGLRVSADSPYVALAQRIEIEGIGDVPYLVTEKEFDLAGLEEVGAAIIFAGSPAECIAALNESDALIHLAFLHNADYYEWIGYDGGEALIAPQRIRDEVTLQVTRAFARKLLAARKRYYAVDALRQPTNAAVRDVDGVLRQLSGVKDDQLRRHIRSLERARAILAALSAGVEARAQELAARARL